MPIVLLGSTLVLFLIISVPVAFAIAMAVLSYLVYDGRFGADILIQRSIAGVNSFPMLALPLFILVGYLMELGSTPRLMRFANSFLRALPGGLAVANVGASAFFGAVSGSGVATIAAVGSVMGPEMVRTGYSKGYATAVMAASGGLGILIPPSVPLIIFGLIGGVSIGALFLASIVPGILAAVLLAVTSILLAKRMGYGAVDKIVWKEVGASFLVAAPPLLLPIIILGGILGGLFTATEAAAVGAAYALFLSTILYREATLPKLADVLVKTVLTSSVILVIIATSSALAWVITINQVPTAVASWMQSVTDSPILSILMIQAFFLVLGIFMETMAIIIITTPIFLPVAMSLGLDPLVYGVVLIVNLIVGSMTPPLAVGIYTAARMINAKPMEANRYLIWFILPLLISGLIILAVPSIATTLPRSFGF
ncbi:TRAP transporter large permease [Aurantimonas sp. A2-1-M11]|uniref:TRAP transporter large permease n=1 Tax=Aurantimonas sp. A2-1-M11 TaxID=3113712 RepID=UPI002F933952